jgi:hypothetical protein
MDTLSVPTPTSNYTSYRQCLAEAATQQPEDWTFKTDIRFQRVLEHVDHYQGFRFLDHVQREYAAYWPQVRELLPGLVADNDRYGKPFGDMFHEVGLTCSPSNFRYLSQALRLLTHAAEVTDGRIHIIELGGGYGGLALYVHRLAHLFPSVEIDAYSIVDLPEAGVVQAKTAGALGVPINVVNGLSEIALGICLDLSDASRFFFSAYAFSEFDEDTRNYYAEHVAKHCEHGVVIWNFVNGVTGVAEKDLGGPVYQFIDKPLHAVLDQPAMYPEPIQLVRF